MKRKLFRVKTAIFVWQKWVYFPKVSIFFFSLSDFTRKMAREESILYFVVFYYLYLLPREVT